MHRLLESDRLSRERMEVHSAKGSSRGAPAGKTLRTQALVVAG